MSDNTNTPARPALFKVGEAVKYWTSTANWQADVCYKCGIGNLNFGTVKEVRWSNAVNAWIYQLDSVGGVWEHLIRHADHADEPVNAEFKALYARYEYLKAQHDDIRRQMSELQSQLRAMNGYKS